MKVSGAQLAIAFNPKSSENRDISRSPITIDAKSTFQLQNQQQTLPVQVKPETSQQVLSTNNAQQARFIRLLATDNSLSTNTSPARLPLGVQQYLQIANVSLASPEKLFDETV